MRRALLLIAATIVVAAGSAFLLIELNADPATIQSAASRVDREQPIAAAPLPAPPPNVTTAVDLDRYVADIEARGRATGVFPRNDIGRAYAAIRALEPQLGHEAMMAKARQLGERMQRLHRELELKPTKEELDRLMKQIVAKPDRATRDRLVASYRSTAHQLPVAYRVEAMARLSDVLPN